MWKGKSLRPLSDNKRPVPFAENVWTVGPWTQRWTHWACRALNTLQKVAGEEERPTKINPSVTSLIKMLVYMTYIAHILGCMWHWLITFEGEGISWASKFGVEEASSLLLVHEIRGRGCLEGSSGGGGGRRCGECVGVGNGRVVLNM